MKYILWNKEAGYVGNNIMFWRKKGHGYTCDMDDAELFDEAYAKKYAEDSYKKFVALKFDDVEKLARREVDIQKLRPYLDKLKQEGQPAPCPLGKCDGSGKIKVDHEGDWVMKCDCKEDV